jgi:amino acid adenylation domain-containing protein
MSREENDRNEIKRVDFDPFAGPEIIRMARAVEPQQEIWLSCAIGGPDANRAYNESVSLMMKGTWMQDAMEKSLEDLINRHEALRSSFSADGTEICIYKNIPLNLKYEDLSGKTDEQQKAYIKEFAKKDASTPFDLLNGPLFRFAVFTLSPQKHYLTLTAHHIICDGWSVGILLQDLGKLYSAYSKKQSPHLPDAFPFTSYAAEQYIFSQTPVYAEIEKYWVNQYQGSVPVLNLPLDFQRPSIRTYKSERIDFKLDAELIASVKKMGAAQGSSLVTTLLSAFEIYLFRITNQDDIVLGLPAAGQSATGHHDLVGHCVHLLPLRSNPSLAQKFSDYLKGRKAKIFDDYDHQQFTFGSLLKKLNMARDPSRVPLVPVVFNIDMGLDDGVHFEGLQYELFYNPRQYENFELSVNASGSADQFVLEWSYNTQLFKAATIRLMMESFKTLLQSVVKDPDIRISEIPGINNPQHPEENNFTSYPKERTIAELFAEQALKTPDQTALSFGDLNINYRQLNEKSNQLANYLKKKGVDHETLVPVCIERSANAIIGILGILKAGGAYVPLDPEYPEERISFMLKETRARLLLCSSATRYSLEANSAWECVELDTDWKIIMQEDDFTPKSESNARSLAYIMYTSGTTGKPKGVMIENRNVVSLVRGVQYIKPTGKEILLSTGSPSFDATTFEYWSTLLNGGQLIICSEETLLGAEELKKIIAKHKVNMMWFTSSLLNQWVDVDIRVFEGLKTILVGGEKLSEKHIQKLRDQYPSTAIINGYGPTENTTFSLTYDIREKMINQIIPIGRPISNRTAYILNPKMQPCAMGVVGELYVGGAGVARGYLNEAALTKEKFPADPFIKMGNAKMYRTGDLASKMGDGNIRFHGRSDDQVKIRGYRIEPGEIEYALKQNDTIQDAVVIASDDNDSDKKLIAYIVPETVFNKDEVTAFLESKLPEFMIPRIYVSLKRLPLTNNGKVDRKALPNPDMSAAFNNRKIKQPETEKQKLVAGIWSEALQIKQLSIDDNFFVLGGHSLVAVKVMKGIAEKTGSRLPITALFEAPTVEKLSELLEKDQKAISWKSLVPIKPEGNRPPLYIVHGSGLTVLVFHALAMGMDPDQPVYGLQARGLNGVDRPFDTMEDIAACYVSEILEQNPNGPYNLAGYSFGGIVAFEMAKQLKALGREINMLAIFDTNADNSVYFDDWLLRMGKKFKRQFPKFRFVLRSFRKYPVDTIVYQFNALKFKFFSMLAKTRLIKKSVLIEENLEYADKINRLHDIAFEKYKMKPYNGTIDLFRVKNRMYYLDDPIYLGWKSYALHGLNIHEISGDHKTFLLPPNVEELAQLVREILNERNNGQEMKKDVVNPSAVLKIV